jgi:hypothetical protein
MRKWNGAFRKQRLGWQLDCKHDHRFCPGINIAGMKAFRRCVKPADRGDPKQIRSMPENNLFDLFSQINTRML